MVLLLCTATFAESKTNSRVLCEDCGTSGENSFVVMALAG